MATKDRVKGEISSAPMGHSAPKAWRTIRDRRRPLPGFRTRPMGIGPSLARTHLPRRYSDDRAIEMFPAHRAQERRTITEHTTIGRDDVVAGASWIRTHADKVSVMGVRGHP